VTASFAAVYQCCCVKGPPLDDQAVPAADAHLSNDRQLLGCATLMGCCRRRMSVIRSDSGW